MKVSIVRELRSNVRGASSFLVEAEGTHYVVSSIPAAPDTGKPETLVFRADADGNITDWTAVCGGMYISVDQAIVMLEAVLNGEREENGIMDNPAFVYADGDPLLAILNLLDGIRNQSPDYYMEDDDES